ncbi:DUF6443 domain-containing protein [Chryseobacterium vrystaatense]|uniref:RHS repeat-associated core domain-containing protein n=1 Tax=Chryseobacterium vrystaatense TaxID=307480 RepID=A0A1M4YY56_9FLAO|nr:DUF6443 domain-containing protein [Chryseobacterium vrystaatense]SHF10628.1 RHS repeat-associated core domain-containing protein [Chryseobacterium vrystaatense]
MKTYFISVLCFFIAVLAHAQTGLSDTENYVYTKNCLDADCVKKSETVKYFDGLGRARQIIDVKGSPLGRDLVQPVVYDGFGKKTREYLPVPQSGTTGGAIYQQSSDITCYPLSNAANFYSGERIFTEKTIESSPLNRIQQQIQTGNDWSNKPVLFGYATNTTADQVRYFKASSAWAEGVSKTTLIDSGLFGNSQLFKNSVKDEDSNEMLTFKNTKGQVILERKGGPGNYADTYFIYDKYDHLAFILPPMAAIRGDISTNILKQEELCYQYRFDGQGRLAERKFPGNGWEYILYDKQDRLVGFQDAELKKKGQWLYTKYDRFGRVTFTGVSSGGTRSSEQAYAESFGSNNVKRTQSVFFNREGMDVYYDPNSTYPSVGWVKLLSVSYYDTYPAYSFNPPFPGSILGQPIMTDAQNASVKTQTMPTLALVKNIEDDQWTKNYVYYDIKGRAVGTYSINHLGGYTKTESELDFIGVAKQSVTSHQRKEGEAVTTVKERFEYDNQNRLKRHYHQIGNNQQEMLSDHTYNELSQLKRKKVGNSLEIIEYSYNIRGWLTKVNDPEYLNKKMFGYELKYSNPVNTSLSSGKFNGNIAEVDWAATGNPIVKRYSYQYDTFNRLKSAVYSEPSTSVPENNFYNETLTYYLDGKIQTLKRNRNAANTGAELIDNLNYVYTGSRINTITDASGNYIGYPDASGIPISYDDNGNMKDHVDKGILEIDYNFLNLPDLIQFDKQYRSRDHLNVHYNTNTKYLYSADGKKLKKTYTFGSGRKNMETSTTTDYLDGFQYTDDVLKFVPTSEGYFSFENNRYIYNYTDHLGNIRVSFYRDDLGKAVADRQTDYYPFGMEFGGHTTVSTTAPDYHYKFLGQELQEETGWVDLNARFYMPEIGMFGQHDPLSDYTLDPYGYAYNNPLFFTDVTGLRSDPINGGQEVGGPRGLSGPGEDPKPNDMGGANNPYLIPEIVLNAPVKAMASTTLPTCTYCYNGNGNSLGQMLNLPAPPIQNMQPVLHNGSAMMMDSMIWDLAGILIANNVEPENQTQALGLGALAIILSKGKAAPKIIKGESKIWKVGAYNELKGVEIGLDAHHVGQGAVMKKLVAGFEYKTAPTILVPKLGHTQGSGVLSRSTSGFTDARQVVARDVFELRRVYGEKGIPNSALQELIQLNKTMYPEAFIKVK